MALLPKDSIHRNKNDSEQKQVHPHAADGYGSIRPPLLYMALAAALSQPGLIRSFSFSSKEVLGFQELSIQVQEAVRCQAQMAFHVFSFIHSHHLQCFMVPSHG